MENTEFKHTPGPWKYYRGGRYNYFVSGTEINEIATGIDDIANAKLIAAVPELLEALQEAVRGFEWRMENAPETLDKSDYDKYDEWMDVIKKATE